jgi:hypothetical protein
VEVETDAEGTPRRLRLGSAWQEVTPARRPWRIDQHWWRGVPVSRVYYRLERADAPPLTVYYDRLSGDWARQEY